MIEEEIQLPAPSGSDEEVKRLKEGIDNLTRRLMLKKSPEVAKARGSVHLSIKHVMSRTTSPPWPTSCVP